MKEEIIQWLDDRRYALGIIAVLVIAIACLVAPRPIPFEIAIDQSGQLILMEWDEYEGDKFYEIQGRAMGDDWITFAIVPSGRMSTALPPGVAEFRVRAWTADGPGRWSQSTGLLFFVPRPEPQPGAYAPGGEEAMLLPWDPELMEQDERAPDRDLVGR